MSLAHPVRPASASAEKYFLIFEFHGHAVNPMLPGRLIGHGRIHRFFWREGEDIDEPQVMAQV